uniref:Diaminopimelate decarboxylase n=1 Tax=Echinostoma caproni TaxID=27848 RepID=A0A183A3W1_9TREM
LSGLGNGGVELFPGNRVLAIEFAGDIALLDDDTQAV